MYRRTTTRAIILALTFGILALSTAAMAATEPAKQLAIDAGLANLAVTQVRSGTEGYWPYSNDGTLAATGAAALSFIEGGYLPGVDVVINNVNYGDVVGYAVNYIFNRAAVDGRFGVETAVYPHYAEDYNNDGNYTNDNGNNQAIYFEPGVATRRLYTTGICAPVLYALGEAARAQDPVNGLNMVINRGSSAIRGKTYARAMQDLVDWFSWGQVEPNRGTQRGGWRYDANYTTSDNSTAQWGALPLLYAASWGLGVPNFVFNELTLWVNYIQNANGGSGYDTPTTYVSVSKTGGLLLQLKAIGAPISDSRVQRALTYLSNNWNTYPGADWYGNLNHPYAMWAVYKGLEIYGFTGGNVNGPGYVESASRPVQIGFGIPAAPGGFTIGFPQDPVASLAGDWYSHYCNYLVSIQNANGSWNGYDYWTGPLAAGWYINILNAGGRVPSPGDPRIRLSSNITQSCAWLGDAVHHEVQFWVGTPGVPQPDNPPDEGVQVKLTLSQHMNFVSATGNGVYDPQAHAVVWQVGQMAYGDEGFESAETYIAGTAPLDTDLITRAESSASNVPPENWGAYQTYLHTCRDNRFVCYPDLPAPRLALEGTETYEHEGVWHKRFLLDVVNWADFPDELFVLAPDLPACGANPNASRSWVDIFAADGTRIYGFCALTSSENLNGIWFAVPSDAAPRGVYIEIWDRRCELRYRSNVLSLETGCVWQDATIGPLDNSGLDGHGVAWGDLDGDGDDDLYVANNGKNKLLRNEGGGVFTEVPHGDGEPSYDSRSAAWGDYDNDGDPDLYVVNWNGPNVLYRNDGGVLVDATAGDAGCPLQGNNAAWADYDNDGDLDLYVTNYAGPNKLLNNDGGVFTSVASAAGFADLSRGCAWGDYDNDRDPDLYVSVQDNPNHLFRNDQGVLVDVTVAPLDDRGKGKGVAWGDYDNDGDLDLYLVNRFTANRLFVNDGGVFTISPDAATADEGDGRSCGWGDYNNDGWLDLYVANYSGDSKLFHNLRGEAFADTTCGDLLTPITAWGMGWNDYDGDGDLDLYVSNHNSEGLDSHMFRNDLIMDRAWLRVELQGTTSNRGGIGARVLATDPVTGLTQMREITAGSGYMSQQAAVAEFGLSDANRVDLTIQWPSGAVQTLDNQPVNQRLVITEVNGASGVPDVVKPLAYSVSNSPNPFNPLTKIEFSLPIAGAVSLSVYDIDGNLVKSLLSEAAYASGTFSVDWNGTTNDGRKVASGVYLYRFTSGAFDQTGRMVLMK